MHVFSIHGSTVTRGIYALRLRRSNWNNVDTSSSSSTKGQATTIERPLTAQQLAGIVPLHPVTLLRWAREGKIPHRRLSARKVVFLPSEINAWLASGSNLYPMDAGRAA